MFLYVCNKYDENYYQTRSIGNIRVDYHDPLFMIINDLNSVELTFAYIVYGGYKV